MMEQMLKLFMFLGRAKTDFQGGDMSTVILIVYKICVDVFGLFT